MSKHIAPPELEVTLPPATVDSITFEVEEALRAAGLLWLVDLTGWTLTVSYVGKDKQIHYFTESHGPVEVES